MLGFSKVKKIKVIKKPKTSLSAFTKTLVVMFLDFWLLILFKSHLKNLTNKKKLCTKFWINHGFVHCFDIFLFYMFSVTLKHTIKQKYYNPKLEKRMLCQIWQFQLRNTLKLSPKKKRNFKKSTTLFFKTTFFTAFWCCVTHVFGHKKNLQPIQKL